MVTVEEIVKRRMRLAAPKERVPVTPRVLTGLAVPFLWALVLPVDRFVLLYQGKTRFVAELLPFLTALAFFVALIFSPREDVVSWERVSEERQRTVFFAAAGCALAGAAVMGVLGAGFWAFFDLVLAVLTLLWLTLPYLALSGREAALRLLLFAMRMGVVWWTSLFLLLVLRDGPDEAMRGSLPAWALGFLSVTYWWFLSMARRLMPDTAQKWVAAAGWRRRYWLGLALCGCLVLLWVLTGFTNDGEGLYGRAAYRMAFPFYDVAALVEPFAFSNGPLLLLHSIPWRALVFSGPAAGMGGVLGEVAALHWLGLFCLALAVAGAFGVLVAVMRPMAAAVFAGLALAASLAMAFEAVWVWRDFVLHPRFLDHCLPPLEAAHAWECAVKPVGAADYFLLAGQFVPTLLCCGAAAGIAVALLIGAVRDYAVMRLRENGGDVLDASRHDAV